MPAAPIQAIQDVQSIFGLKNRIINGGILVDYGSPSRASGASQTITAGTNYDKTFGGWWAYCTGANVTCQQIDGSASTTQKLHRFTGAASVTKVAAVTVIELLDSYDLAGKTCTLSALLASSTLTSVTWTIWYANSANSFGTVASPTRTQIATGTFTINSTLSRYNVQIAIPSAAITGLQIELSVGALTSGTFDYSEVQLESSNILTAFDIVPYFRQILRIERRYEQGWGAGSFNSGGSRYFGMPIPAALSNSYGSAVFRVAKASTPTIIPYDENGTSGAGSQPGIANGIGVVVSFIYTTGFGKVNRSSGNYTTGSAVTCSYVADNSIL